MDNVGVARDAYEAFNSRGVEAILEYLDPEIEWRTWERFARGSHVENKHDGVRRVFAVYAENFDGLSAEPAEFIDGGEKVVVPFTLRGKAKGSGEPLEVELVHVWTVDRSGQATRLDVYESREEALRFAGLSTR